MKQPESVIKEDEKVRKNMGVDDKLVFLDVIYP